MDKCITIPYLANLKLHFYARIMSENLARYSVEHFGYILYIYIRIHITVYGYLYICM